MTWCDAEVPPSSERQPNQPSGWRGVYLVFAVSPSLKLEPDFFLSSRPPGTSLEIIWAQQIVIVYNLFQIYVTAPLDQWCAHSSSELLCAMIANNVETYNWTKYRKYMGRECSAMHGTLRSCSPHCMSQETTSWKREGEDCKSKRLESVRVRQGLLGMTEPMHPWTHGSCN